MPVTKDYMVDHILIFCLETVSMKGLFLGLLEKKEEGYEFARQAIKYNFKSHVCTAPHHVIM